MQTTDINAKTYADRVAPAPNAEGDAPKAWWRRVANRLSKMTFI